MKLPKKKKNDEPSEKKTNKSAEKDDAAKKPRKKRQYKDRATRRREILDAAETLFLTRGFGATGVKDIAKAVGISYGVFYHHFPTKRDILLAFAYLRLERAEKMVADWNQDPTMTAVDKLRRFLEICDDAYNFRVSMDYLKSGEPREDPELYDTFTTVALPRLTELIAGIIDEGNENGEFQVESPRGDAIIFCIVSMDIIHRAATLDKLLGRNEIKSVYRTSIARMLGLPPDTFKN
jgi:AcrR family transcriptional regulator